MSTEISQGAPAPQAVSSESSESQESSQSLEQSTELQGESQEASAEESPAATKKAVEEKKKEEKRIKKLKLKVDGKEFEEEVNLDDDDYLTKQLQMAKMAQKRAQEKSAIEKEFTQFMENVRKNPRAFFENPAVGVDLKQFVSSYIEEEIARSQKSPQELEREKLQKELEDLKSEREREKQDLASKERERQEQQAYEKYDREITQALDTHKLPKNREVVGRFADYLALGLENGIELTADEIGPLVRKDLMNNLKEAINNLGIDEIEEFLGKEMLGKLRKQSVAKAKEAAKSTVATSKIGSDVGNKAPASKKEEGPKMTYSDLLRL